MAAKKVAAKKKTAGSSPQIAKTWARLERWFAEHAPDASLKLRPDATPKEIAAAEKALGVELPADFRESLAIHDGQEASPGISFIPYAERLGPLEEMIQCWKSDRPSYDKKDPEGRFEWLDKPKRVRQVHFHPKHIAFAGSTYWDYGRLLFDFIPGPKGTPRQIIARDDIDFFFVSDSWSELLERTVAGLENGTIELVRSPHGPTTLSYRRGKKHIASNVYFA